MPDAPRLTLRSLQQCRGLRPHEIRIGHQRRHCALGASLLIDLETEQGITGRTYLFCYMPMGAHLIGYCLQELFALIKGDPVDPAAIGSKLLRATRLIGAQGIVWMALAAIDILCWDVLAQAAEQPLCSYLGSRAQPDPRLQQQWTRHYESRSLRRRSGKACSNMDFAPSSCAWAIQLWKKTLLWCGLSGSGCLITSSS